jgi:hypothetical protein
MRIAAMKKQTQTNPICEKPRNERNHLFYNELRKLAPPEDKLNRQTASEVQEQATK